MTHDSHRDDEQISSLLVRSKTEREAMGQLLEIVRPFLLEVSSAELAPDLQPKIATSDVVQNSLLEIVRDLPHFSGTTVSEFREWASAVLLNNLANWDQRGRRADNQDLGRARPQDLAHSDLATVTLLPEGSTPGQRAEKGEKIQVLQHCMAQLPDHDKLVLQLRHWEHLSFEEIGNFTERSPDAARVAWWRAVVRLQELMGEFK